MYTCSVARCDYVVIVAAPEQIPILKMKYGDGFYDLIDVNFLNWSKSAYELARPMGILYISPQQHYAELFGTAFNMANVAKMLRSSLDDAFELIGPSTYFMVLPWIVINPQFLHENIVQIRKFTRHCSAPKMQLNLEFRGESDIVFGDSSHRLLKWWQLRDTYAKLIEMSKTSTSENVRNAKINEVIEPGLKPGIFTVPDEHHFNIKTWKGNIQLINAMEKASENENCIFPNEIMRIHANIPNLPKMHYFEDLQIMNDVSFGQMQIKRDFHKEYKLWKKRKTLRARHMGNS